MDLTADVKKPKTERMSKKPLILFVTAEIYPFSKTGGLGDVMGALPVALQRMGANVAVITPLYGRISTGDVHLRLVYPDCPVRYPWPPITAEIYQADYFGVPVYFIHRGEYFDRRFYYSTHGGDYFDNCERFIFFCRAALEWAKRLGPAPAVVHAHDWHAALVPAYLSFLRKTDPYWRNVKTVMTIHNLAFQGRFSSRLFWESGLPASAWHMEGAEFYGDFNLLKAGVMYADSVTTVSPSYAREIRTHRFGCGLEGVLEKRASDLSGILNGADYEVWDPANDKFLPATYSLGGMKGKRLCKLQLIDELGMDRDLEHRPLLGFIGRLRYQKGIDLLIRIMPELMRRDVGVVVLGEGNLRIEARLLELMEKYHGRLFVRIGYTEDLAHRIQAGTDIFLMPSRYEPCGLTQMYSLRYGTIPVATAVGGLKDTIVPYPRFNATGFIFAEPNPRLFLRAVSLAVYVWKKPGAWNRIRKRAMLESFSWERSAKGYLEVYKNLGTKI